MSPTTPMLMNYTGVRDKDAVSLLDLALLTATVNSALVPVEDVPTLVLVVVHAPVTLDLMVASSSTPTLTTIVKTLVPRTPLDYPLLKATVEVLAVDASKVLYLLALPLLVLLLSASSSAAVDLAAAPD